MALNPTVKALLDSAGIESNLEDVPAQFEETKILINQEDPVTSYHTEDLVAAAGTAPSCRTELDKYWHVRQFFIKEDRSETRKKVVSEKLDAIKSVVRNGNKDQVLELFKRRHLWRKKASEYCTSGDRICSVENCPNLAVDGSDFCVNHIMQDSSQKLFTECPHCHRPYPVMSKCFACREGQSQ